MNLKCEKPNMKKIMKDFNALLTDFNTSGNSIEQLKIIDELNNIRDYFFTMYWLSYINYLLDVNDPYWNEQEKFFAVNNPIMDNLNIKYLIALDKSKFKDEIAKSIGNKVFKIAKLQAKLQNEDIQNDLVKEKELGNKHTKLIASSLIDYDGEKISFSKLNTYCLSSDRNTRKKAHQASQKYMETIEDEIDTIFDEIIKVRTNIAKKLGFNSYTEVGYLKMNRIGYDKTDIKVLREEIVKYVVPLMLKLKEKQRQELNLDKLAYYDNPIFFHDGNAKVLGDTNFITSTALEMYKNISPEIYSVFKLMRDTKLFDLESRDGKDSGAITTYLPIYQVPIFIANFTGISDDIRTLVHEFGHAFQLYSSRNLKYYENWWPTFDTCEIHSTAMELLTLPYMNMFFGKDNEKYIFEEMMMFLSSICSVALGDEFQELIYDNYNLTKNERKELWHSLEKKYAPWIDFEDNDYLERGCNWQKNYHYFNKPFYYIDYALARVVSFQFYEFSLKDEKSAWEKYIEFSKLGGSKTYLENIEYLGFKSPFEKDILKSIVISIEKMLNL